MLQEEKVCEPLKKVVGEMQKHIFSITQCYDSHPWIFMRNPQQFEAFVDEMIRHVPGILTREMKEDLIH